VRDKVAAYLAPFVGDATREAPLFLVAVPPHDMGEAQLTRLLRALAASYGDGLVCVLELRRVATQERASEREPPCSAPAAAKLVKVTAASMRLTEESMALLRRFQPQLVRILDDVGNTCVSLAGTAVNICAAAVTAGISAPRIEMAVLWTTLEFHSLRHVSDDAPPNIVAEAGLLRELRPLVAQGVARTVKYFKPGTFSDGDQVWLMLHVGLLADEVIATALALDSSEGAPVERHPLLADWVAVLQPAPDDGYGNYLRVTEQTRAQVLAAAAAPAPRVELATSNAAAARVASRLPADSALVLRRGYGGVTEQFFRTRRQQQSLASGGGLLSHVGPLKSFRFVDVHLQEALVARAGCCFAMRDSLYMMITAAWRTCAATSRAASGCVCVPFCRATCTRSPPLFTLAMPTMCVRILQEGTVAAAAAAGYASHADNSAVRRARG
jgi:hypothetical protein